MNTANAQWRTAALCTGMAGALLMYAGDLLLFGNPANTDISSAGLTASMAALLERGPARVMLGGAVGPLAGLLYAVGFCGLGLLVRPDRPRLRWAMVGLFCLAMAYGGAYHSHFPQLAFTAGQGAHGAVSGYVEALTTGAVVPMAAASLLFIYAVLRGATVCARYTVLLSPLPLIFLAGPLQHLPPPLLTFLAGGWNNLLFVIFFGICARQSSRTAARAHIGSNVKPEVSPGGPPGGGQCVCASPCLADLEPGEVAGIDRLECPPETVERLAALGLMPGSAVRVLRGGKTMVVECCGTFIALADKFAGRIVISRNG